HEERRALVNDVSGEVELVRRVGLQADAERVGPCAVRVERKSAIDEDIEELLARRKFVEIHRTAEATGGCQSKLTNEVLSATAEATPTKNIISRQRGG